MFIFKKIVDPIFSPLFLCIIISLIGVFLLWFTKRQKTGKLLVSTSIAILLIFSYSTVSNKMISFLEYQYTPLYNAPSSVKWIVVLGGGHISDPKMPISSQISRESLVRLTEAIRLHREIPQSKLVLCGGKVFDKTPEAQLMYNTAIIMNVSPYNMIMESKSRDTEEQAKLIGTIVKKNRFILVTSALHMPRAIKLFRIAGLTPIPAPTDYITKKKCLSPRDFYPAPGNLDKAERAFHEYIGIIWTKINKTS
jgi:uncharacterized SAM-binding protein YcdF (DUF218 family)